MGEFKTPALGVVIGNAREFLVKTQQGGPRAAYQLARERVRLAHGYVYTTWPNIYSILGVPIPARCHRDFRGWLCGRHGDRRVKSQHQAGCIDRRSCVRYALANFGYVRT
jgi:hypothetical protein